MRALPQVGYMRALSAEGVAALHPDLVLLSDNAGPPAVIEQMRGLGIPLKLIPDRPTPEGVADKIRAVGAALGRKARLKPWRGKPWTVSPPSAASSKRPPDAPGSCS